MKFTLKSRMIKTLNLEAYHKGLTREVEIQMKEAAKEFVRAAAPRVPVRSGFAKGSLLPLAEVSGAELTIQVNNLINEYYYTNGRKIRKTPEAGARFGKRSNIFTTKGNVFYFNYDTSVIYYVLQDVFRGRSPSAPWGSFEIGRAAFVNYLVNFGIKKLPNIFNYAIFSGSGIR